MNNTALSNKHYLNLIEELKQQIGQARIRAHLAVNKELVTLYWNIGRKILERQKEDGWGAKIIENISKDLRKEFPEMKGLSAQNLKYMRKFAEVFDSSKIGKQPVDQIPWGHIVK